MTLLIPNFKGGASGGVLKADSHTAQKLKELGVPNVESMIKEFRLPLYWGTQPFTSGPVYIGAVACLLFVLGLFIVKGRYKWGLLGVTILSILLSWGENFSLITDFFINHVPMYNKFRTVSMTLVMAGIAMPLLGMLAVKKIMEGSVDKQEALRALQYSLSIVGGICLLFWIFPSLAGDFVSKTDAQQFTGQYEFLLSTLPLDRKEMLSNDAFRSLCFVILISALLFFIIKDKLKTTYAILAFGVLFTLDVYPVAKRYLNDTHFTNNDIVYNPYKASEADKLILQDKTLNYRVLNLTIDPFNDASPSYFHKNIGGYHAAKLRRYQELINIHLGAEIQNFRTNLMNIKTEAELYESLKNLSILNMLNMRYLILNPNAAPVLNPYANGSVWLVEKVHIAENANEEMLSLAKIDTKKELVVDKKNSKDIILPVSDSTARIELIDYKPMHLKYQFSSATNQMAVFSEIFYDKGWNAYINGEQVPYFRANYLLRAMPLKAGSYDIEFRFEPTSVSIGNIIAIISNILIVALLALICWFSFKKEKPSVK
jgi:hypothetical protein